jgi:hypothetical protein
VTQDLNIEEEKTTKEETEITTEVVITEVTEMATELRDIIRGTRPILKDLRKAPKIESQATRKTQEASKREKEATNPETDSKTGMMIEEMIEGETDQEVAGEDLVTTKTEGEEVVTEDIEGVEETMAIEVEEAEEVMATEGAEEEEEEIWMKWSLTSLSMIRTWLRTVPNTSNNLLVAMSNLLHTMSLLTLEEEHLACTIKVATNSLTPIPITNSHIGNSKSLNKLPRISSQSKAVMEINNLM